MPETNSSVGIDEPLPHVSATLNYLAEDAAAITPFIYIHISSPPPGEPRTNFGYSPVQSKIYDVRGHESRFSLDTHGVAFSSSPVPVPASPSSPWTWSESQILEHYYPNVEELLLQATGGASVRIFDHTLRKGESKQPQLTTSSSDAALGLGAGNIRAPVLRVHNDYTPDSAAQRVRDLTGDRADGLLEKRFQVFSVWRPINRQVVDTPLAVLDARTASEEDFVRAKLLYTDRVGEIYCLRSNPAHRWYYLSDMTPDEVMLLKTFDSYGGGDIAKFSPHSAFENPLAPPDAPPRESIEVRAIVFFG